ncbi:hypothetical protein [uncultured Rummeliibacillus sp.]|uniref:hypothetical protein n=1 Tax=uncultured Rummeliibacillus sp. TaxID=762292 RepID=UPI0026209B64|nr:hypothetical protein [uncultured Rummeliibacillus sp.]
MKQQFIRSWRLFIRSLRPIIRSKMNCIRSLSKLSPFSSMINAADGWNKKIRERSGSLILHIS